MYRRAAAITLFYVSWKTNLLKHANKKQSIMGLCFIQASRFMGLRLLVIHDTAAPFSYNYIGTQICCCNFVWIYVILFWNLNDVTNKCRLHLPQEKQHKCNLHGGSNWLELLTTFRHKACQNLARCFHTYCFADYQNVKFSSFFFPVTFLINVCYKISI